MGAGPGDWDRGRDRYVVQLFVAVPAEDLEVFTSFTAQSGVGLVVDVDGGLFRAAQLAGELGAGNGFSAEGSPVFRL